MAESQEPKTSGSQPLSAEGVVDSPKDVVLVDEMDKREPTPNPTADGTLPMPVAGDNNNESSSTQQPDATTASIATEAETSSKGKEKEEAPAPVEKQKEEDSLSIGPSNQPGSGSNPDAPVCSITLLLPTGARHPYRLDEKYLTKRNVEVPDVTESGQKDPFSISIYKLKELILREWREEWEGKPASPSSIRLIHFGKLLDDKEQLKKYQFTADSPNVVHMSVRPPEMIEEDEAAKGKTSTREGRSRESSGGCCVIL